VLAVLVGTFSGIVVGVAAGARRTATAFPRLTEENNSSHALVATFRTGLDDYYERLARHPDVAQLALIAGMPIFPATPTGEPIFINGNVTAPIDGRFGYSINRPQILAGRLPARDRSDEVFVNEVAASRLGLRVGAPIDLVAMEPDPTDPEGDEPLVKPFAATVTGIGRFTEEVVATTKFDSEETLLMSAAAYRRFGEAKQLNFDGAYVRMKDPDRLDAFRAAATRLASDDSAQTGGEVLFADHVERNRLVQRTIGPQALALALFAAFAGVAGWVVLGQALSRQVFDQATDTPVLRALGLTRSQVFGLSMARAGVVAVGGAVVAVVVAVAMSPLFPIGAARRAEVHEGVEVNLAFLAVGALAVVVLFLIRAAIPAWRTTLGSAASEFARDRRVASRSVLTRLASAGLSPSVLAGVRMAVEPGRGRSAIPVRATLAGAAIGLAAVAATMTFAANMNRVVATPDLYGRTWDATFDGSFGPMPVDRVAPLLDASPAVARWSGGLYFEAAIGGRAVTAIGTRGPVQLPVVEGRSPRADNEIALGTRTLRVAHRHVGERIDLEVGGEQETMTVVGRVVFPALGRGSFPQTGLGDGLLTTAAFAAPPPDPEVEAVIGGGAFFNFYLIDIKAGAPPGQVAALGRQLLPLCPEGQDCKFLDGGSDERPAQITNLDRIRWTPVLLAALLAVLAVATVGHTLVTSIRRRRRDLALLKTIGFVRGQISAAVAWQATTIALVAVVVGLPLGLALGRVLWRALAEQMGIVPDVVTPGIALLVAGPATLLVINLIAVVPGWLAGRIRPGVALRAE
jgi:ABC-type lipoprotein release transport system permease subunit